MSSSHLSPFPYSDTNKRYHAYSYYLKNRFGAKVYRVSLDIGSGCPNRSGEKGVGGCIFCSASRFPSSRFSGISDDSLRLLYEQSRSKVSSKCPSGPYIAYFQSGSNTYGDLSAYRHAFETALTFDNVVGLCIATRADCIDKPTADMLSSLSERTYLTVELGLQTIHDVTARLCNRGHTYAEFLQGYKLLRSRNINIGVHIINGLPNETREMMLSTARAVSALSPHCVKIHMLYIERGTPIARLYGSGELTPLTREEYVSIVCDQLELLPPETKIARLTGDADRELLIAPDWSLKKLCVMNEIDKELLRRGSYQGKNR